MVKIKKASRRGQRSKQTNYNTLYRRFGREFVNAKELEFESEYPVTFGKASELERARILNVSLSRGKG